MTDEKEPSFLNHKVHPIRYLNKLRKNVRKNLLNVFGNIHGLFFDAYGITGLSLVIILISVAGVLIYGITSIDTSETEDDCEKTYHEYNLGVKSPPNKKKAFHYWYYCKDYNKKYDVLFKKKVEGFK